LGLPVKEAVDLRIGMFERSLCPMGKLEDAVKLPE
jgi:hypothetical protein